MNVSAAFIRSLYVLLSLIFMITYVVGSTSDPTVWNYVIGAALGLGVGGVLIALDQLFKKFNLRSLNIAIIGLFFGYLLSLALIVIFDAVLEISNVSQTHTLVEVIKIFIFLFGTYLGVTMTLRAANEIYVSIPFVRFTPTAQKSRDILLDPSALSDPRMIDLASSGLLDKRLILPRFLLKELQYHEDEGREKRSLDILKKLETLPTLGLRYQDTDFPDIKEGTHKVLKLARLLDADVLSADMSRIQMAQLDGVRVINIHALSNALKPLMQRGEQLRIKIQRVGKEDRQGVGYLEDGTMVVVNGGGGSVGETVQAHVLSVKHTSSGRLVFCNLAEEEGYERN